MALIGSFNEKLDKNNASVDGVFVTTLVISHSKCELFMVSNYKVVGMMMCAIKITCKFKYSFLTY